MKQPETIKIDEVEYIRKDSNVKAEKMDDLDYVIIRGDRSGVFAGYLKERDGKEVVLLKARRIWYWAGANSISQLAVDGTSKPNDCKFPTEIEKVQILDVIEVIDCTEKARKSIAAVPVWAE